jgi:PKD repeat protein
MIKTFLNHQPNTMKKTLLSLGLFVLSGASGFAQQTCASAQVITAGTYTIPAINGTELPATNCATGGTGATAANWYKYTATQANAVTVTTNFPINGNVDNRVHIYSGACGSQVCVTGNDDNGSSTLCVANFNSVANTDYYIVFDNLWSSVGFNFELIENTIVAPDTNVVTFTSVYTGPFNGSVMGVVDMNGDFLDDLLSVSGNNIQVKQQNTNGTFTSVNYPTTQASYPASWSLAVGDYNADGYNDLLYGGGSGVTFMESNGLGTGYTQVSGTQFVFSQRSNFVDMNNDGHLDAFVCHDVAPNVYYLNNGSGVLTFNQGGVGDHPNGGNYGSHWVDYNNDRLPDLFIAKCRGGATTAKINELHRNNGNGTFTDVSVQANLADSVQTWSSAWNDYDNDGWMDVVVGASSNSDGMHKFMHNNGDGTFTDITAGSGLDNFMDMSIEYVTYDFNNDGFTDVLTDGFILYNNGDKTFSSQSYPIQVGPVGDLNNDGFMDVHYGINTYINAGNTNNWLKVTLEGTNSNLNGIGARVEVYGSWGKQIRDVRSGVGFRYMGTLNTHFGLGAATEIDSLVVKWPSGTTDVICNPAINVTLHVVEDTAPVATAVFTSNSNNIAENDSVQFTDASTPCPTAWSWSVFPNNGWSFSNGTSGNSKNPSITFSNAGTYVVSLVASNSNGNSINQAVDTIQVYSTFGLGENGLPNLSVYPNPVKDQLYFTSNAVKIKAIKIVSVLGAELEAQYNKANNSVMVDNLEPGTYFVVITTDTDQIINTRFIKK